MRAMVEIWVDEIAGAAEWIAVAYSGDAVVATAVGDTREAALTFVSKSIRRGLASRFAAEPTPYARSLVAMLADLEAGHEEHKRFTISDSCVLEPLRSVLYAAASIPMGYVTHYGAIAALAETPARVVGGMMATNPLYPIVPCHRVVGADFALVGYGGKQNEAALLAKLNRLRAEARGYTTDSTVETPVGILAIFPVERVIAAARDRSRADSQLMLFG